MGEEGMASSENARTSDEADTLGTSGNVEDTGNQQKKPRNASEHVRERLEQGEQKYSPRPGPDKLDTPDGETAVPGGVQRVQGRPSNVSNDRVDRTDAPARHRAPGSHRGEQEAIGNVKGDSDRRKVVDYANYDGICLRTDGNERSVETDALRQDRGPGGLEDEQEAMGSVERDWKREMDVKGAGCDGNSGRKGGATSGARYESKQVETRSLA